MVCRECGQTIPKESNTYFCVEPLNIYLCSEQCMRKHAEKEKEKEARNRMFRIICRLFSVTKPTPQMWGEIKRFREKNKLSYAKIAAILHYIYDVKGKIPYGKSLYLVPEYADAAEEYYQSMKTNNLRQLELMEQQPTKTRKINFDYSTLNRKVGLKQINPDDV